MPSSDQGIPPHLKEREGSWPHVSDPATCPYPEPDQSSTCPSSYFLNIHFPRAESHVPCLLLASYQRITPRSRIREVVSNVVTLYGEELLALRQDPKLEDHPLSVVRDWFFSILSSILEAVPPSKTWGRAVPWWHESCWWRANELQSWRQVVQSQTRLVDVLLLRSFIHIAYPRNNYMFRPFSRPSSGWSYILFEETSKICSIKSLVSNEISFSSIKKVNRSRYRRGVAQMVPGS